LGAWIPDGVDFNDPLGVLFRPLPFNLQTMPQLKTLAITAMELFPIVDYFTPAMFPRLQKVALGATPSHVVTMYRFVQRIQDLVFETVTSFELSGLSMFDDDFDAFKNIFPNTKWLKLTSEALKITDFLSGSNTSPLTFIQNRYNATERFFRTAFELAACWDLEELVLDTKFRTSLSGLFKSIPVLALTVGLKSVSISMKSFSEDLEAIDTDNNILNGIKRFLHEVKDAKVSIKLEGIRAFYDTNIKCNPISVALERFALDADTAKIPLYFGPSFFAPLDDTNVDHLRLAAERSNCNQV